MLEGKGRRKVIVVRVSKDVIQQARADGQRPDVGVTFRSDACCPAVSARSRVLFPVIHCSVRLSTELLTFSYPTGIPVCLLLLPPVDDDTDEPSGLAYLELAADCDSNKSIIQLACRQPFALRYSQPTTDGEPTKPTAWSGP
jgi:hypothetical protein